MDYTVLKNELKIKEDKVQATLYDYNELLRQKERQENDQQSSMKKMISIVKKVKRLLMA